MPDKTILITGASAGFGKAIAERFGEAGYRLILVARRIDKLEELKAAMNIPVHIQQLDVRNNSDVKNFVDSLPEEFSHLDVLVNNAGLALGLELAWDADMDD